ncbi:MAG: NACHT domain-containing protein [Gammaproteobacteria bacterium]|nr:NACHT domain-containing protein [Gammaproteobacteria bacterium]MBU1654546.1 NACHT domain-containing protein [Gammaproteobacteria bacterium]MBU1961938.1 NACHT domain-containing protein [Gammaproteobacteria bacterium]
MDVTAQQKRLLGIVEERFSAIGGYVAEGKTLHLNGRELSLQSLLSPFRTILDSREFTHLPPLFDAKENFPIADMYVELAVAPSRGLADPNRLSRGMTLSEELETRHDRQRARRLTIEQAVHNPQHRNLVVLGDPGSGKTSLLRYLTLQIAGGNSPRWILPLYISLRRYWQEKKNRGAADETLSLTQYAAAKLFNERGGNVTTSLYTLFVPSIWKTRSERVVEAGEQFEVIENLLAMLSGPGREHVLFLLDGFDELASQEEAVESLTHEIRQLSYGFSWVLTSRQTGFFGGLDEDIRYEVVSLHKQGIEDLVGNWFRQNDDPGAQENRKQLLTQIQENPRLLSMARNPFLLTLLCYIRQNNDQPLPLQRSEIYDQIVALIRSQLRFRAKNPALFGGAEYDYLARFCHYLYTDAPDAPKQLFDQDDWSACAKPDEPPSLKEHFLPSRLLNGWWEGSDYHFIHLTFQEYFIAQHLARQAFDGIRQHLYKPHWRMVLRFLAGIYWKSRRKDDYGQLLRALVEPPDLAGLLYIEAAWILVEAGLEDSTPILGKDLRDILWQTWLEGRPYVKDSAGEALAILAPGYLCEKFFHMVADKELPTEAGQDPRVTWHRVCRAGCYPSKRRFVETVSLLGRAASEDADQILIDLFFGDYDESEGDIPLAATAAIGEKNTPEIRKAILARARQHASPMDDRLCKLAEMTRHRDFVPWLLEQLPKIPTDDPGIYSPVLVALTAIASPDAEEALRAFIDDHDLLKLPFEAMEAFAAIQSDSVKRWFAERLACDDEQIRQKVLVIAIAYDFMDTNTLVDALYRSSDIIQHTYIESIGDRAATGRKTDRKITDFIAGIAFSDHENAYPAIRALTEIALHEIESDQVRPPYLQGFRACLYGEDEDAIKCALHVLGKAKDRLSFDKMIEMAEGHHNDNLCVPAIQALANFAQTHKGILVERLKGIIDKEIAGDEPVVLETALDSLTQVDIREAKKYLHLPISKHTITLACAEQGLLLFDDFYVDRHGSRHSWEEPLKRPTLNPSVNAVDQQAALRSLCRYLLDRGLATKAGKYIYSGKVPLFSQNENVGLTVRSVDKRTGDAFLKGDEIGPAAAQRLMDWINEHFPLEVDSSSQT